MTRLLTVVHFLALMAAPLFLGGCAGVTSPSSSSSSAYSISGTITPASAGSGVTVSLSGPTSSSTTATSSGSYSFAGLTNGTYVVTPSRTGYSFNPTEQTITINGANVTGIDFSGSTHSVKLSWKASTSPVVGYNIYRSSASGGPYTKLNSQLITTLSYTDTSVSSGITYYYVCTSVDSAGNESTDSNQVVATVP